VAIFGKADADRPLLTQMYQLAPDNFEELAEFYNRYGRGRFAGYLDTLTALENAEGIEGNMAAARVLSEFAEACELVRGVLDNLHDHGAITPEQRQGISEAMKKVYPALLNRGPARDLIPLECLEFVDTDLSASRLGRDMADALRSLMEGLKDGKQRLERCPECRSVFLRTRADQQFCSHRCADRVSTRRRRQARKLSDDKGLVAV